MSTKQESNKHIFEYRIKEMFGKHQSGDIDLIWQIVSLLIYQNSANTDVPSLFSLVDEDDFLKIINLFGGRTIHFPTVDDIQKNLLLAILYYYKEIKGMPWEEIKKVIPFEFTASDSISYGIKIRNFNTWMRQKLQELFRELENNGTD